MAFQKVSDFSIRVKSELLTFTTYARRLQEGTWLALVTFYVQREVGRNQEPSREQNLELGAGTRSVTTLGTGCGYQKSGTGTRSGTRLGTGCGNQSGSGGNSLGGRSFVFSVTKNATPSVDFLEFNDASYF